MSGTSPETYGPTEHPSELVAPGRERERVAPRSRGRGRPVGADSAATRSRLLETAREVIAERGFVDATIREIADRADVNPALVHYYFGTKAGVRRAVIEGIYCRLRELLQVATVDGPAMVRLRGLVCAYLRIVVKEPRLARMILHELVLPDPEQTDHFRQEIGQLFVEHLESVLREGMAAGEFRDLDLPDPLDPVAANILFFGLVAPWIDACERETPKEEELVAFAKRATDLLLYGISARRPS